MDEVDNSNYNTPVVNEGVSDGFLKLMIEVEETMLKFEMEVLRRKRLKIDYKKKEKVWVPIAEGVKPICNELGISEILGSLRSKCTTIARLSKKTMEQILKDMHQFHRSMIELITLRADDWELDEELTKPLLEDCLSIVQDIAFSSENGFTAINIRSTYSRHENATSNNDSDNIRTKMGIKV
jgi:hypothetical protein